MAFTLQTHNEFTAGGRPQGRTIAELVLEEVTNLKSRRRPLMASIGSRPVSNTFVELLTDALPARAHNAVLEGIAFTDPNLTQPVRHFVHVQSFYKSGRVSDEQRLVRHYNEDPYLYQIRKSTDCLLNDIEHALHRGSAASGTTDAARQFNGLLNIFTSHGGVLATAMTDITLTEQVFTDHLEVFRSNSLDTFPTQAYVNTKLKRTISLYSTKVTRNVDAASRYQVLSIERHTSDFGDVDVLYTEDQFNSANVTTAGSSIVYLDPTMFRVGWLRAPMVESLSRDGLSDRYQINAQATMIFDNVNGGGSVTSLVPYITLT